MMLAKRWQGRVGLLRSSGPRQFLAENVPGMLTQAHMPYTASVVAELESLGYRVEVRKLDAVHYGVPQFRKRIWLWGIRADVDARHCWPAATHAWPWPKPGQMFALRPAVTVGQALGLDTPIVGIQRLVGASIQHTKPVHGVDEPSLTITDAQGTFSGVGAHLVAVGAAYNARGKGQSGNKMRDVGEPAPALNTNGLDGGHHEDGEVSHHRQRRCMWASCRAVKGVGSSRPRKPNCRISVLWRRSMGPGLAQTRMGMEEMVSDLLSSDPNICGGETVIAGTRIATSFIYSRFMAGESVALLADDYDLPIGAIDAALRHELLTEIGDSHYIIEIRDSDGSPGANGGTFVTLDWYDDEIEKCGCACFYDTLEEARSCIPRLAKMLDVDAEWMVIRKVTIGEPE